MGQRLTWNTDSTFNHTAAAAYGLGQGCETACQSNVGVHVVSWEDMGADLMLSL